MKFSNDSKWKFSDTDMPFPSIIGIFHNAIIILSIYTQLPIPQLEKLI